MNQIKFYRFVMVGLLLLNMFVLAFFLFNQSDPRPNRPPRNPSFQEEVPQMLELDSAQQLIFDDLADQHNKQISTINQQQQALLLPYFGSIASDSAAETNEFVLTQFQALERKKLEITYQHFVAVKNILSPQQIPLFKILMGKITDRIVMQRKKSRP